MFFPLGDTVSVKGILVSDSNGKKYPSGSTYSLGSVLQSTSSSLETLKIENDGSSVVTLTNSPNLVVKNGIHSAEYTIDSQPSVSTFNSGDTDTFQISFQPSSEGVKSAYLIINSDDPNVGTYILYLTGTGTSTPAPSIEVSDSSLRLVSSTSQSNYYAPSAGSSTRTYTIKNSGQLDLNVSGISLSGTDASSFATNVVAVTIAPKGTKKFTVTFNPSSASAYSANLQIASNDPNIATFSVSLSGTKTSGSVPQISVSYSDNNGIDRDITESAGFSYSFGSVFPNVISGSRTITIRNLGSSNLDLSGTPVVLSGSNPGEFTITQPGVTSLAANAATTFTVKFAPTSLGTKNATVTLSTSDGNGGNSSSSTLGVSGSGGQRDIIATWANSKEKAVHMASGGYKVCYKKGSTFTAPGDSGVSCQDVLYSSGSYAPNFTTITVQSAGTWFVRVKSFSTYNSSGSGLSPVIQATVNSPGN